MRAAILHRSAFRIAGEENLFDAVDSRHAAHILFQPDDFIVQMRQPD